jgi:hypothetical protein
MKGMATESAVSCAEEFVVGYQTDEDDISRRSEAALLIDLVAIGILDGARGIHPHYVHRIKAGRRLRPALETQKSRNMIAFVLSACGNRNKDQ